MLKKKKEEEYGFHWIRYGKNKRRPMRDLPLKIKFGNKEIVIKPGEVGGIFDRKSSLSGDAWVDRHVVVEKSRILSETYIEGDATIEKSDVSNSMCSVNGKLRKVSVSKSLLDIAQCEILNSTISMSEITCNKAKIAESKVLRETKIVGSTHVFNAKLSDNVIVENGTSISFTELCGKMRIQENSFVRGYSPNSSF